MSGFTKLFEPGLIGKMELRNRIVMAPMGTSLGEPDGRISRRLINYYAERARGGAGMIIVEAHMVSGKIEARPAFFCSADSELAVQGLADLTTAIHCYGAKACLQLTCGLGMNAFIGSRENPPVSASAVPFFRKSDVICRPLTTEEIKEYVDAFGRAAKRAKRAGFDAIEIHAHAGYLLDQFMTPLWNKRRDEYGGSFENRMRFPVEIIKAIRTAVGDEMAIIYRMAADHLCEGGRGQDESAKISQLLEREGVDALDIDAGCYSSLEWITPPSYLGDSCLAEFAGAIKTSVNIPVLNAGNHSPESAQKSIQDGKTDFIISGRALLADSDWPNKVLQGRREEVRPCIRCNEYCIGGHAKHGTYSCAVNARVGSEDYYPLNKVESPKKVVVVGGGPAGMEAARIAAIRGHRVTLLEKGNSLGGQLCAASTATFKRELYELVEWFKVQLKKLNVEVYLNTEAISESFELTRADVIIVALGASPTQPSIPGIQGDNVIGVIDCHLKRKSVGHSVVVAGGGLAACDVALELAIEGKQVTMVLRRDIIAPNVAIYNRLALLSKLGEYKVRIMTGHQVLEFTSEGIVARGPENEVVKIKADTIVTAFGMTSANAATKEILAKHPSANIIGDCVKVGTAGNAIRSGFFAGWAIE